MQNAAAAAGNGEQAGTDAPNVREQSGKAAAAAAAVAAYSSG